MRQTLGNHAQALEQLAQHTLALFIVGLFASWALTKLLRAYALRRSVLDVPNERSSHTVPTPRGGGLSFVVVTLCGWLGYFAFIGRFTIEIWAYALGALVIAAVSWIDDVRSLSTKLRFAVHLAAAVWAVAVYGQWPVLVLGDTQQLTFGPTLGYALTLIWIVGLTNAFNFMDGLDGLAATQAFVAALCWLALSVWHPFWLHPHDWATHLEVVTRMQVLGALLACATLGFLFLNWPPAKIFMGDVGSAFLGYTFAVFPLLLGHATPHAGGNAPTFLWWNQLPAVLCLWPFLFDTTFTFFNRLRKGERVFEAHRSHLFQRLNIAGWKHLHVTLLFNAFAASGAIFAFAWSRYRPDANAVPLFFVAAQALCLWSLVRHQETRR